jgi:hypothetical protein
MSAQVLDEIVDAWAVMPLPHDGRADRGPARPPSPALFVEPFVAGDDDLARVEEVVTSSCGRVIRKKSRPTRAEILVILIAISDAETVGSHDLWTLESPFSHDPSPFDSRVSQKHSPLRGLKFLRTFPPFRPFARGQTAARVRIQRSVVS